MARSVELVTVMVINVLNNSLGRKRRPPLRPDWFLFYYDAVTKKGKRREEKVRIPFCGDFRLENGKRMDMQRM